MERDRNTRERQWLHLRLHSQGETLGRLLHDYDGAPLHGGSRRDIPRDRPRAEDLMDDEFRH